MGKRNAAWASSEEYGGGVRLMEREVRRATLHLEEKAVLFGVYSAADSGLIVFPIIYFRLTGVKIFV